MVTGHALFDGRTDSDQLQKIFQFLGSPTSSNWPSMPTYPNAEQMLQKPEFRAQYDPPQCDQILASTVFQSKIGAQGVHLLKGLLQYEPEKRLTASQALSHPYFSVKF